MARTVGGVGGGRHHLDPAAHFGENAQLVVFDAEIKGHDLEGWSMPCRAVVK
jgi:hypothetical protein